MNDLVYYLGQSTTGSLKNRLACLGQIGSMMKGMLYEYDPDNPALAGSTKPGDIGLRQSYVQMQEEVDTYITMVDLVDHRYTPLMDTNPYLYKQASRVRKGAEICSVLAYHIIAKHNLVSGNIMRARLAEHFGQDRIKGNKIAVGGEPLE